MKSLKMKSLKTIRLLFGVSLVLTFDLACGSSGPTNGSVTCATGSKPCPDGFYCHAGSNTCWKTGQSPDSGADAPMDMARPDSGAPGEAGSSLLDGPRQGLDSAGLGGSEVKAGIDSAVEPTDAATIPDVPAGDDVLAHVDVAKADVQAPDVSGPAPDAAACPAGSLSCGGKCVDPKTGGCCAASDCAGSCMTCGPSNTCVPLLGQLDPTGRCTGTCDATGTCKSKLGQACQAVGGGCAGGTFCSPEGLCCDRACTGSCEACDLAGALGTCTILAANAMPRTGHTACIATDTVCAGKCDGSNAACAYSTAACGTPTCTSLVYQAAGTCNAGACKLPATQTCASSCNASSGGCTDCVPDRVRCNATSGAPQKCTAAGSWQDQAACGTGSVCDAGLCVDLQTDPANCGTLGHACQGGGCTAGKCQPVAVAGSLNPNPFILGVDASNVYFGADNATGGLGRQAFKVSRTATNATGLSALFTAGGKESLHGVLGGYLITTDGYPKYQCNLNASTTCANNRVQIAFASDYARLVPWRSPAPQYYAVSLENPSSGITLETTWGSTTLNSLGEPTKILSAYDTVGDYFDSFFAAGNYVYWIRALGTDRSLFASSSSSGGNISKLAGGLSGTVTIADANAQSILLWDVSDGIGTLSRLPAQTVGTPTLLTTMVSPPSTLLVAEDAAGVYWFDADGSLYRCSPTTCAASKTKLVEGQQPNHSLHQDTTALYWASKTPAAIMRLAK
jgi:hypothetical protein